MTRRITDLALLCVIAVFTTALPFAQPPSSDETATESFAPQLKFDGQEPYDVNGTKGTRYKLSVTNRPTHSDFLWKPTGKPCGTNENASRTWVEVFGSPGDKRLAGFCALRSSEDLAHLWFPVQSGEKGPQCVYIVMTDQRTGKRYESNQVCSRSFTVVRGRPSTGGQHPAPARDQGWIEVMVSQATGGAQDNAEKASRGQDAYPLPRPVRILANKPRQSSREGGRESEIDGERQAGQKEMMAEREKENDPGRPPNKIAKIAKPDLRIRQFLFPPTNDKALRVHVVNTGQSASGACRLILTVRKINGVAVGRKTHVNVPALAAGAGDWLHIDAESILPNNVSLHSTTFKVNVDGTEIVAESNEANNEVWHNL